MIPPPSPSNPTVSVVIPTLNREEALCDTIRYFLERERYPSFELIVIDQSDTHTSATAAFLQRHVDRFHYVHADYKSLPKARNHGTSMARGAIVVFTDDDVLPCPGFLDGHVQAYADGIVGVTGPVVPQDHPLVARSSMDDVVYEALMSQRAMRFDVGFAFAAQWAVGCNMSFLRSVIVSLGGFDERFIGVALGEDAEFSHRAKRLGRIAYAPRARLAHLQVPTGGCRDATQEREYARQVGYCTNYFWSRVDATVSRRWHSVLSIYRTLVRRRDQHGRRHAGPVSIGYALGVLKSQRVLRSLRQRRDRVDSALVAR